MGANIKNKHIYIYIIIYIYTPYIIHINRNCPLETNHFDPFWGSPMTMGSPFSESMGIIISVDNAWKSRFTTDHWLVVYLAL